jgi:hypothetical protein
MTDDHDERRYLLPITAFLALGIFATGCSLRQRPYAFASPPPTMQPRTIPYGGQVGSNYGYPTPYSGNYGTAGYGATLAAQQARCDELDSMYTGFGAAAAGGAVAAGSAGAIAGISEADKNVKIGLAIGSGVVAAFSAISSYVSQAKGQQFQRQCPLVAYSQ